MEKVQASTLRAYAIRKYDGKESNELTFRLGDIIQVLEKSDQQEWWRGKVIRSNQVGFFQKKLVKIMDTSNGDWSITGRAIFGYERKEGEIEISLRIGDIVKIRQALKEDDWWEGELAGVVGFFPSVYVKVLDEPQSIKTSVNSSGKIKNVTKDESGTSVSDKLVQTTTSKVRPASLEIAESSFQMEEFISVYKKQMVDTIKKIRRQHEDQNRLLIQEVKRLKDLITYDMAQNIEIMEKDLQAKNTEIENLKKEVTSLKETISSMSHSESNDPVHKRSFSTPAKFTAATLKVVNETVLDSSNPQDIQTDFAKTKSFWLKIGKDDKTNLSTQ